MTKPAALCLNLDEKKIISIVVWTYIRAEMKPSEEEARGTGEGGRSVAFVRGRKMVGTITGCTLHMGNEICRVKPKNFKL